MRESFYDSLYSAPPASRRPSEPHKVRFWKIEMAIGNGHYITLCGIYTTKVRAELNIPANLASCCRAQEYQQGRGTDGPERVNS